MFSAVLRQGAALLDAQARARIQCAVLATAHEDGGFQGRDERPDPYYAPFAVAILRSLGFDSSLPPELPDYLRRETAAPSLDWIHRCSLAQTWALLGDLPEARRSVCGDVLPVACGHPHADAAPPSPYARFLTALVCRTLGVSLPPLADRGWRTSPEAAALLVQQAWQAHPPSLEALAFLEACIESRGGIRASPAASAPDLLCTATGLLAFQSHQRFRTPAESREHARFVSGCWRDSGLFAAAPDDPDPRGDSEYTFHALLALGALQSPEPPPKVSGVSAGCSPK